MNKFDINSISIKEKDGAVTHVFFDNRAAGSDSPKAQTQLNEYLAGKRKDFSLKLNPEGTSFQKQVWDELLKIPYGQTRTYGQIAMAIGRPKASRAVGSACNKNPVAIIIPCHRIVGKNNPLAYASGAENKKFLLDLESKNK